jgi:D-sedoheptulose 7-phosphate isomerase
MSAERKFPLEQIATAEQYAETYFLHLSRAAQGLDRSALARGASLVEKTILGGGTIYSFGNGGSAAISNHLLCDFAKGIQTDTALRPKVVSLSSHVELLLAIGNDLSFEDVFQYQAATWAHSGDLLMAISSSGNSENIVRPLKWAKANGIATLALTGFDGGRAMAIADVGIHVAAENYGVVEDIHQSIMHLFAQYIRQKHMDTNSISARKF